MTFDRLWTRSTAGGSPVVHPVHNREIYGRAPGAQPPAPAPRPTRDRVN